MKPLTEKQRNYLTDYLGGMTLREIGAKYGVSFNDVAYQIHIALDGKSRGGTPLPLRKRSELAARLASDSDT